MLRFDIITIFPSMFDSYLRESILARAQKKRLIKITTHNLRDYTTDKHQKVDDRPFGGGAGMVLKPEPIYRAVNAIKQKTESRKQKTKVVLLSAKGKQFTQKMARSFSKLDRVILICGRYEGIDERIAKHIADDEISVGPYVLTGGELPAMVLIDAMSRHIPGVLGNATSLKEESFSPRLSRCKIGIPTSLNQEFEASGKIENCPSTVSSRRSNRKLKISGSAGHEYPHYTRPEVFKPKKGVRWGVPKVLLSGDHNRIAKWRKTV